MKMLDEVIKAFECCENGEPDSNCKECSYIGIGSCCLERENDALHYLREYHTLQYSYIKAMADLEDNPPLTFDELKEMEGKPVWLECEYFFRPQWVILTDVYDYKAMFIGDRIADSELKDEMGDVWQAYRKERK